MRIDHPPCWRACQLQTYWLACILCLLLCCSARFAEAQTTPGPEILNFQGRLAKSDGTPISDGTVSIRFSLWSAPSGGTEKWFQVINPVLVRNGMFAVLLGNGNPITADIVNNDTYLEIKVGDDASLSPRQRLVSVAYALKANTVPDGSITTSKVANGAVTAAKLAASVTNAGGDLAGTYPNPAVAPNAIISAKLASDAASLVKVSGGFLSNTPNGMTINGHTLIASPYAYGVQSPSGYSRFSFYPEWTNGITYLFYGANGFHIAAADYTLAMFITPGGNVGIGTTTPGQKLSVAGVVESTLGGFKFPDGTVQTTAASSAATGPRFTRTTINASSGTTVNIPAGYGIVGVTGNGNSTVVLPRANSVPSGTTLILNLEQPVGGSGVITVGTQGGDKLPNTSAGSSLALLTYVSNPALRFYSDGGSNWYQW